MAKKRNIITAREFDRRFDNGEDITDFLDWENAKRLKSEQTASAKHR